jgi:hypothetical protein
MFAWRELTAPEAGRTHGWTTLEAAAAMPVTPPIPPEVDVEPAAALCCLFTVDAAKFALFEAILGAPPCPSEALRRTMQTAAPWEAVAAPDRDHNLLLPQQ